MDIRRRAGLHGNRFEKYFNAFKYFFLKGTGGRQAGTDSLNFLQIRYEKTAVVAAAAGFVILSLCDNIIAGLGYQYMILGALVVLVPTLIILLVPHPRAHAHLLFSAFYLVTFFAFFYPILPSSPAIPRSGEHAYLLHIFLLLTQAVRPGRFVGLPVVLVLFAHSAMLIHAAGWPPEAVVRLPLFLLAGGLALFVEGVLYLSFVEYVVLRRHYQRSLGELELAEQVHKNLFPAFRQNEKFRISAYRDTESLSGGDFFDIIQLREGNLGFFLTDVAGHGIASAMFSAAVKVILTGAPYRFRLSPEALLTHLDDVMRREYTSHHASAVYLFFDFQEMTVRLANAGHPPVLYAPAGGKFREIETKGSILGFGLASPIAVEVSMPVGKGDRFLVYSDGLADYRNHENEVTSLPSAEAAVDGLETLHHEELVSTIVARVKARDDFGRFHDDVMLILLEVK